MKHAVTKELFAYWDRLRGNRALPDRSDIDPAAIRRILGDVFIAACDEGFSFRLAGTRLCAMFTCELRETPFLGLWDRASRAALGEILSTALNEGSGTVASISAHSTDGRDLALEMALLPLRHRSDPPGRLIGTLVPMKIPYWLEVVPLGRLTLGAFRHVGPATDENGMPSMIAPQTGAPQRETFVVHEGGRRD